MQDYCNECGTKINEEDKFCGECGAEIVKESSEDFYEETKNEHSGINELVLKLGGTLLLFAGGIGLVVGSILVLHGLSGESWNWYIESFGFTIFEQLDNILTTAWGLFTIMFSAAALISGFDTLDKKYWGTTIGSVMGLFAFGPYFIITILCLCALILITLSKSEFNS